MKFSCSKTSINDRTGEMLRLEWLNTLYKGPQAASDRLLDFLNTEEMLQEERLSGQEASRSVLRSTKAADQPGKMHASSTHSRPLLVLWPDCTVDSRNNIVPNCAPPIHMV